MTKLHFGKTIEQVINEQVTRTATRQFTEYVSKKRLFAAGILDAKQTAFISDLKGTFTFNLHIEQRYLIATMYYSQSKKYGFLVIDLLTMQVATADSIKQAKQAVIDIVKDSKKDIPAVSDSDKKATKKTDKK